MRIAQELWDQMPETPECDQAALVLLMERLGAESYAQLRLLYLDVLRAQMLQGRELGGLHDALRRSSAPPEGTDSAAAASAALSAPA